MKTKNLLLISLLLLVQYYDYVKSEGTNVLVVDCTKKADGTRLVDPASCTNYYKCLRGIPIRKACHTGYYFDDVKFECNYAALVDCSRSASKNNSGEDLAAVVTTTTVACTTPCPVVNPVQCLCGNHGGWPLPYPYPIYPPYPYPLPYPYPGPHGHHNCSDDRTTTPSPTPDTPTPPAPTPPAPCPPAPTPPAPCPPAPTPPAPCPPAPCAPTPCPCTPPPCKTPAPCTDTSTTSSADSSTTPKGVGVFFVEHPISKRLYYEVKNGKKRLRKCAKGQVFDMETTSCKIST